MAATDVSWHLKPMRTKNGSKNILERQNWHGQSSHFVLWTFTFTIRICGVMCCVKEQSKRHANYGSSVSFDKFVELQNELAIIKPLFRRHFCQYLMIN